jgi:predicted  nucleic acid-binding Zn-ribbon protein
MSQAFHLLQLQKIDTQLDQIQSRISQIERILSSNEALSLAIAANEASIKKLKTTQEILGKSESAVQMQRSKVETSEAALYSGKIRIPKELQELQLEITSLKKRLSNLEDEQLEAMVAVEQAEKDLENSSKKLVLAQAEAASQSAGLLGEQSQLQKHQERLGTERLAALSQITTDILATYYKLREQKRGLAVCQVEDNACAGCGSTLRPETRQAARSPLQVVRCESCGRILYAG